MHRVETVVIGAGVIGLAVARALARAGREVLVLEAESGIGQGVSSRSSEVIHAGLYYAPGSLKARLCVEGRVQLYDYCNSHGVGHRQCGKLLVAADSAQLSTLEHIRETAVENGVDNLRTLTASEAKTLEPALHCVGALHSPSTGIVDSHGLMLALLGELEDAGGVLARQCRVEQVDVMSHGFALQLAGEADALHCRELVNAAGLGAVSLARRVSGLPSEQLPTAYFAKGQYFRCGGSVPFSNLIYPVPQPGGLGIHLTLDLDGRARFGPDVQWIDAPEFAVDPDAALAFETAIRQYWPALPAGSLRPDYAGVRPKIAGSGEPAADFNIACEDTHGVAGYVGLYGIESPGLTASLAIARCVRDAIVAKSGA